MAFDFFRKISVVSLVAGAGALTLAGAAHATSPAFTRAGNSVLVTGAEGTQVRLTPYGRDTVRIQAIRAGEAYFDDHHYEMVESHKHAEKFKVSEQPDRLLLELAGANHVHLEVDKATLAVSYFANGAVQPLLRERGALQWQDSAITRVFDFDEQEHFTALGHSYFGRAESIDLKGQIATRNYGKEQIDQAPLLVPFYISSKGYGVFLNSTFKNHFNFGNAGHYEIGIDTRGFSGRMDYFFIAGPQPKDVLAHYVALTGKPRLPSKAMFGLALSDKGHDHDSPTPSDEAWWKRQIGVHRAAGYPLDHVVNDNRWRAGGGKRCESRIEWDRGRFPDPAEYARWLKQNGLVSTIDFNRCIAQYSDGWKPGFNLPETGKIDFGQSAPDLTSSAFRSWFWYILYRKSLRPALKFPGDALWIDEFDEQGRAPEKMVLANGLSSAEMRNYWFFLIAKSLVQQGWDRSDLRQRPFVWVRGMTAGAQRYATLWSGDIKPNYEEMKAQIRGMQLAGLSGFPFWGHDAGGFFDWESKEGPNADLYKHWSMAFGSFSPIWKPHGPGPSRWPTDRSAPEQEVAHQFATLRYELMPYMYSAAHEAADTGLPIARAMLLEYPQQAQAWRYDLQYMWGPALLAAPYVSADQPQEVWLPAGTWYDYWHPQMPLQGDTVQKRTPDAQQMALYVKAGAILTRQKFALSTAFGDKGTLLLDVYPGADGDALLVEDDDHSEAYRLRGKQMKTSLHYDDAHMALQIGGASGDYAGAPRRRAYQLTMHGQPAGSCFTVNGKPAGAVHLNAAGETVIEVARTPIRRRVLIQACKGKSAA